MSDGLSFDLRVDHPEFSLTAQAEVPGHGITALSGPSGSGKTTLLRAIAGLEPAQGQVRFAGRDWTAQPAHLRDIGYVFQEARLFPHLSVADNLNYGARRRGTSAAQVAEVVAALDLGTLLARAPATLSGGEARRVALGRALAARPRLLLLDEPLTGLDRARKIDLMPYVARAVTRFAVPAIYVSHSAHEIAVLSDRTLHIAAGRLTGWSGPPPRVTARITAVDGGLIELGVGPARLWLPGSGEVGEGRVVPLGRGCVISARDPGASSARWVLEGRVIAPLPEAGSISLTVDGDQVTLPWPSEQEPRPAAGECVWLSLPDVIALPTPPESIAR